jgi:hypothetical protein
VKASDAQRNLVRGRKQQWEGSTTHQTGKNPGQIQTCLRRQKVRLITSQRLLVTAFWGETVSPFQGVGRGAEVLCYVKVYETPPRVRGAISFSWEIATTKVKGWTTKIQFQRGRLTENRCIIHYSSPLAVI